MSQIPRSQFAMKKRQQYPTIEGDHQNGSSKVKKSDNFDNDVLIIDDMFSVVGHEEVIATHEEDPSPGKRKRNRKSKDSTESKDSDFGKSPSARKSSTNGSSADSKIVKASFEDFTAKQRRSRADRLQNASTIVNLSTVSTSESTLRDESTLETTPTRTSGRRSARAVDEIKFEYRTTDLDDSLNTTTNATIGSEANDSIATPGDRKRPMNDDEEVSDSPKRSRLDLSGLFSSFSSPVTLLRNRFKRTNIGASTPVVAGEAPALNDSIESLEEITSSKEDETPVEGEKEEELEIVTTPIEKKKACIIM